MQNGVGTLSKSMLFKLLRRVSFVRQFWLCLTLIGLSVFSVTHLTLPSAVLCYKQMPKGVSE